nr:GNAT family N-acetyltransferase [Microlunatus panaciterrae]
MSRPVQPEEGEPDALPAPRPGVSIRRVDREADGSVAEEDVRRVHDVLEQAFVDHFNSHTETFAEFYLRLRTDPGHRWDHWWLAELVDDGPAEPAGALVATVTGTDGATEGSYVEYLGVLPNARGRGVATSLLYALIADAAQRGRDMVGLEVDADSPTGADRLYTALGFSTAYVTESWHCQLVLPQR